MSKDELGLALARLKTVLGQNGMALDRISLHAVYKDRMRHLLRQEYVGKFANVTIEWLGNEPEMPPCLPGNERGVRLKDMPYREAEELIARHAAGEPIEYFSIGGLWFEKAPGDLHQEGIYRIPPEVEFRIKDEVWTVFPNAVRAEVWCNGDHICLFSSTGYLCATAPICNIEIGEIPTDGARLSHDGKSISQLRPDHL